MPSSEFIAVSPGVLGSSASRECRPPTPFPTSGPSKGANDAGRSPSARSQAVTDVHIVWLTAGLSCDGDSVSVTAAEQPSIEDVVMGAIPGLPKVHLHNPVLAYEVGDDFMKYFYQAERGDSIRSCWSSKARCPTRRSKSEGYWAAHGHRSEHRPADHDHRMDRSAGAQSAGRGRRRHLRHLRRHSRHGGQSHRRHGPGRLSRLELALQGRTSHRQCSRLPGAARQLHGDAALPALPGRRASRR